MTQDWLTATACDLGRAIEAGEIDPVALTQTYLDAIAASPLSNRIYARVTRDRAMAEATAAALRAKSGTRRSMLDGVPISWKDLFDTAGIVTEAGSKLLKDRVPATDARVLKYATDAGLVCLGKTHMSELAFSGLGLNPSTQTPPCVNDLQAVSGGSSSGAAASVSFNLAAIGIGSDTGGSVRIPAAWNDLVGFKTTAGELSLEGVVPLCREFDTVGPLCRSVEDASYIYEILRGDTPTPIEQEQLKGKRFLNFTTLAQTGLAPKPKQAFDAALDKIRDRGAIIDNFEFPEIETAMALSGVLFTVAAYAQWQQEIEATPELMYPEILKRFQSGLNYSGVEYLRAWHQIFEIRANYNAATLGYDAVLMPSSPILPPNHDRLLNDPEYYVSSNLMALRNTRIGNLLGVCALSLPTDVASCGLMIMAPPFGEKSLLNIGAAVEAAI